MNPNNKFNNAGAAKSIMIDGKLQKQEDNISFVLMNSGDLAQIANDDILWQSEADGSTKIAVKTSATVKFSRTQINNELIEQCDNVNIHQVFGDCNCGRPHPQPDCVCGHIRPEEDRHSRQLFAKSLT